MERGMIIKFDEIDAGSTDTLVPPGKYRLLVKGFERLRAKTGMPQIMCDLEILDKPEFDGCIKKEYFPIDEKSLWRVGQFIKVLTDTTGREVDVNSAGFDDLLQSCLEKTLYISYGVEEFNGLEKNIFRRYLKDDA